MIVIGISLPIPRKEAKYIIIELIKKTNAVATTTPLIPKPKLITRKFPEIMRMRDKTTMKTRLFCIPFDTKYELGVNEKF